LRVLREHWMRRSGGDVGFPRSSSAPEQFPAQAARMMPVLPSAVREEIDSRMRSLPCQNGFRSRTAIRMDVYC